VRTGLRRVWMTGADQLQARVGGAGGGGGQATIVMSCHGRGLQGRTDGQVGTSHPAAERRDGL